MTGGDEGRSVPLLQLSFSPRLPHQSVRRSSRRHLSLPPDPWMEEQLQDRLGCKTFRLIPGTRASGCISAGHAYEVDDGARIFVKKSSDQHACAMVAGEFAGLQAIAATHTVRVPQPLCTVFEADASAAAIAMEYLSLSRLSSQERLGEQLADLHRFNERKRQEAEASASRVGGYRNNEDPAYVTSFGFESTTCCGSIPMNNEWHEDWETFFARNRLGEQVALVQEKSGDRECLELWSNLQLVIPRFFRDVRDAGQRIRPALLHGDLWTGNTGETDAGPVVFDPASFYGDADYDLAIGRMFGGFSRKFYSSYSGHATALAPNTEQRLLLYELFHQLNHWNHFGDAYRKPSVQLMRRLLSLESK